MQRSGLLVAAFAVGFMAFAGVRASGDPTSRRRGRRGDPAAAQELPLMPLYFIPNVMPVARGVQ